MEERKEQEIIKAVEIREIKLSVCSATYNTQFLREKVELYQENSKLIHGKVNLKKIETHKYFCKSI